MPWDKLRSTPRLSTHPGSSAQEIENEPEWGRGHNHRVGFRNRQGRQPGLTHDGDLEHPERDDDHTFTEEAQRKQTVLRERAKEGDLIDFRDVMRNQTDYHKHRPEHYPPGFRFVVQAREDWVKNEQDWPGKGLHHIN